ncbi:MAG: hypothetical protein ACPIOQ_76750, partial [Promethearchaeia archaeon]
VKILCAPASFGSSRGLPYAPSCAPTFIIMRPVHVLHQGDEAHGTQAENKCADSRVSICTFNRV